MQKAETTIRYAERESRKNRPNVNLNCKPEELIEK